jgi:hypothetical protein
MMLDDIASIDPDAEALVDGVGNLAFAVQRASMTRDRLVAAGEVAVSPAAAAVLERIGESFFGHRAERPGADRPHSTWGAGPVRLFRRTAGDDRAVFGAGRGGSSVRWYLGEADEPAPAPADRLAHLVADPQKLASQLGLGGLGATLLRPFRQVEATLAVEGDLLVATWTFTP